MIAFALVTSLGEDGKENGKEGELFQVMILLFLANEISSERSKSKNLPLPPNNHHQCINTGQNGWPTTKNEKSSTG